MAIPLKDTKRKGDAGRRDELRFWGIIRFGRFKEKILLCLGCQKFEVVKRIYQQED